MSSHRLRHGGDRPAPGALQTSARPRNVQAHAWPPEVYSIGCDDQACAVGPASAQTMGFKAWNLLRMSQLALPVPAAFVIGTRYCADSVARSPACAQTLWQAGLHALERATGQTLGDGRRPLLLSVRSGAPVSMPGMMETLLNIGLNDTTVGGLLRQTGNPRLVWDAYRRLVATYGEVVAGLPARCFDEAATALFGGRDETRARLRGTARADAAIHRGIRASGGAAVPAGHARATHRCDRSRFRILAVRQSQRVPAPEPHSR